MEARGVFRAGFGIPASIIFLAAGLALDPTAHAQEWTRQFGTSSDDRAMGISVAASGIYVVGYSAGSEDAAPCRARRARVPGSQDAFVRKYDANGSEVWTRQFGSSSLDLTAGISVAASGIYVAGSTEGTLPGQKSTGSQDAFVVKLSSLTPAEAIQ